LWILIIQRINNEKNLSLEYFFDSIYGKELFNAFASDNPDAVLLRWLRARKWNLNNAFEQLFDTLKWRIEWDVQKLVANGESDLSYEEMRTGKSYYIGYDRDGRPIIYVSVKDHIKGQFSSEQTEKLTVFSMEIGRKLLRYPMESVTVLFDMNGFSMKNMDYQHVKFLINLLQNYYPESLGLALVINSPWLFNSCWFIIKSWLDPTVENKIHFIQNLDQLNQFIDSNILPKRLNGKQSDFNYIQPTEQDQIMLNTFRMDIYGKTKAIENHQQASKNFLQITFEWAQQNDKNFLNEERKKAMKQLSDAYQQLLPYISTKTHYHRIGLINEPIFDITFQNIQTNNQHQIVHF
jgi:hypothetical protein